MADIEGNSIDQDKRDEGLFSAFVIVWQLHKPAALLACLVASSNEDFNILAAMTPNCLFQSLLTRICNATTGPGEYLPLHPQRQLAESSGPLAVLN